ncbi:MAG TPA: transcription termination factor NusA [Candidatus Saccharimonadales bacterium]|nr:transcription termination factor NusA [Candidatus Saccharimonadales bacterium]
MKQLALAVRAIAEEKNLPEETVQEIVEQALAAAYRRDYGDREQEVRVTMNLNNGDVDAYVSKEVVKEVTDDSIEIDLTHAQVIRKNAKVGETVEIHEKVENFGRVAAQTAKQVILQRLREAEREIVMAEYQDKIGTVINGIVSRVEANIVRIELGKAQGILPKSEQIQGERYFPGQRLKVFLKDVERGFRGPQLVVSRGNSEFIEWLFRSEVPEMENGAVEIKDIAREAGVRTKIAVHSTVPGVDPVGTFVGGHGTRVNAVVSEVGEMEKIDIVVWDEDIKTYITNALSPTKVDKVTLDEKNKKAVVVVPEDQLSIAIGKSGQNVRLASKLTGYEIDISAEGVESKKADSAEVDSSPSEKPAPRLKKKEQLESSLLEAIEEHGTEHPEEKPVSDTEVSPPAEKAEEE